MESTSTSAATGQQARLHIDGLSSGYGEAAIVRAISISVGPGEILTVLGKNGMGKSTLLKTIMGYLHNRTGRVTFNGTDITNRPPHLNARDAISYTPQEYTIFQELTVEENLRLGVARDADLPPRLADVGKYFPIILQRMKQKSGTLSGGEQKMLLLSRALVARPKIMLIDEISEGLQPSVVEKMANALRSAKTDRGISVLLVEQNLPFALSVADKYAILKLGEIVETGGIKQPDVAAKLARHLQI